MQSRLVAALAIGAAATAVMPVQAQQTPASFVFATYYRCNQSGEARADTLMQRGMAPIYDKHLAAGHIVTWAWLTHDIGGAWRRLLYMIAPTRDQLLQVRADIVAEMRAMGPGSPTREFSSICSSHDDYVWATLANGPQATPANAQGGASLGTYYECDMGREARADEIFRTVLAPIYEKHAKAGEFRSWAWLRHELGGRARRLATIAGTDGRTLLTAWDGVFGEAAETAPLAFQEFLSICSAHNDYVWNVQTSKP